jgi:acetolactate synthase-1/2/3 large subunit
MADGYARAKNAPGGCPAQQIGASISRRPARSFMAHTLLIAITGPQAAGGIAVYRRWDFNQLDAVTKRNLYLDDLARLRTSGDVPHRHLAPGPFTCGSKARMAGIEMEGSAAVGRDAVRRRPPFRPAAGLPACARGGHARAAQKPVSRRRRRGVLAGAGQLVALAEKLQVPVATSLTAKGAISDLHEPSAGVCGIYRAPAPIRSCPRRIVFSSATTPAANDDQLPDTGCR